LLLLLLFAALYSSAPRFLDAIFLSSTVSCHVLRDETVSFFEAARWRLFFVGKPFPRLTPARGARDVRDIAKPFLFFRRKFFFLFPYSKRTFATFPLFIPSLFEISPLPPQAVRLDTQVRGRRSFLFLSRRGLLQDAPSVFSWKTSETSPPPPLIGVTSRYQEVGLILLPCRNIFFFR